MSFNSNYTSIEINNKNSRFKIETENIIDKKLLSLIKNPNDLKNLTKEDIPQLCDEIRQFLIKNLTKTGGHLGSNLGVVEVTTALHYVFNFLKDALIFDVSHQCYVHKILTSRKNRFKTLRQLNGLSGFTNKYESEYDKFTSGHAGTSISTAIGVAEGFKGSDNTAVVLIGDASISTGMSFEALNHLGQSDENVLIILNDNEMSIAPTVGSLSKYLTESRTNPGYLSFKEKLANSLKKIPLIGNFLFKFFGTVKNDIKRLLVPRNIFTDLSIPYYGPIDGHDSILLINTIEHLKRKKGPKLLHILTVKGKGMPNLENERTKFHSAPVKTHNQKDEVSYTKVFGDTVCEIASKKKDLVVITAAMPDGTGLVNFQQQFPDRFYDVGICEQHAVGLASGLATSGFKPVCAIYSTFIQRAYDQVFQEICLQNVPVILGLDRGGIVGNDGATHNGVFDIAFLRTLPNIVLCSPKDGYEFKAMLNYLTELNKPSAIRYSKGTSIVPEKSDYELAKKPFQSIELGKAEILNEYTNADVTIFAYGSMVEIGINAVRLLKKKEITANLVNLRFVKPIDSKVIKHFAEIGKPIVTLEEHSIKGGVGSAVIEELSDIEISNIPVKIIGVPDKFIEHGNREDVLRKLGLDSRSIAETVSEFINKKFQY